jgi:hypothetical protein
MSSDPDLRSKEGASDDPVKLKVLHFKGNRSHKYDPQNRIPFDPGLVIQCFKKYGILGHNLKQTVILPKLHMEISDPPQILGHKGVCRLVLPSGSQHPQLPTAHEAKHAFRRSTCGCARLDASLSSATESTIWSAYWP